MKKLIISLVISLLFCFKAYAYAPDCAELDNRLPKAIQNYLYDLARERYADGEELNYYYASLIGLAQGESEFNIKCVHENDNGSIDRGLFQTNSCWIKSLKAQGKIRTADDLLNPFVSCKIAEEMWFETCYSVYGFTEPSYARYLYGRDHETNKWTLRVFHMQISWFAELYGDG